MTLPLPPHRARLVEETLSAYRERDAHGRIIPSAAFYDLSESDRELAFEEALKARALEASLHPEGHSTTTSAVLARIRGIAR